MWTSWYVKHNSGTGLRLKSKPHKNQVHVGAGSVSQMVRAREHSYEIATIDGIVCVRFTLAWAKHHEYLLSQSFTLKEYQDWKFKVENPNQSELEDFFKDSGG